MRVAEEIAIASVDVRDMLCAQALALVAKALGPLPPGHALDVTFNADDVKRDLLAWAGHQGYAAADLGGGRLRLTRGAAT